MEGSSVAKTHISTAQTASAMTAKGSHQTTICRAYNKKTNIKNVSNVNRYRLGPLFFAFQFS